MASLSFSYRTISKDDKYVAQNTHNIGDNSGKQEVLLMLMRALLILHYVSQRYCQKKQEI
jgi:hypothetical protein